MMIGPMKKKVITSVAVTATILILAFVTVFYLYATKKNEQIATLEEKGKVVQRYVFTRDLAAGDIVTAGDIKFVDVKDESAPIDSFVYQETLNANGEVVGAFDQKFDIIGQRLKVNVKAKTIVVSSAFFMDDKAPNLDTRMQEFNMITLPSDLDVGDFIDVRLRFPTGEDYSVIVGKKIYSFGAAGEESNTIFLRLNEEEIIRMSSAIIESYIRNGVYLYANKYVDPENQLYESNYVDFVERYEKAKSYIISGETVETVNESGEIIMVQSGEVVERTSGEIASIINLPAEEVEIIRVALEEDDEDTLEAYRYKLEVIEKAIVANYPVKPEVATLLANNPNVMEDVRQKYTNKIQSLELEAARENFLDSTLTEYDDDGNLVIKEDYLGNISGKLETEIQTQKTERQQYLLKLLQQSTPAATN